MNNRNRKTLMYIVSFAAALALIAFLATAAIGQTTTNEILKTSDTTFVEVEKTTYPDGRIVTVETPYNSGEFAERVVNLNIEKAIRIDERAAQNLQEQREVNQFRRYVIDSLGINADSILNNKLLTALGGNWKFIIRGNPDQVIDVEIDGNPNNPVVLRMRGTGVNYTLRALAHTQSFEVRNFGGGPPENVPMRLTQFQNFTGYRGVTSDGTVLILRR